MTSEMPKLKLSYFELPARAEPIKLMLAYANIPYEFESFSFEEWPQHKPKTPFGQAPVLEVDGKQLAQSYAIGKYVAKLAGLYPEDPWQAAKLDEAVALYQEIPERLAATHTIPDKEAKAKAREEVAAGPLAEKLGKLSQLLGEAGGEFFGVAQPNFADFWIYCGISWYSCGFYDGIPPTATLLAPHPALLAHHNRMASLPAVEKEYKGVTEGLRLAFKTLQ